MTYKNNMKSGSIRIFIIATLLSAVCIGISYSQTPQLNSRRRPVLVDDVRVQPLYQTDVLKDWNSIPHLNDSQRKKIVSINSKAKKKLIGVSQTLTKRIFQLETLYANDPTNAREIGNKEREIAKLEDKLDNIVLDSRKKIRKLLDPEQIAYLDSTDW